ncbi:hypothetical protein K0U91_15765 [Chryseobacterium chendengshani]|uniref:lanthionine synthetase LanC family protein n=1 Tax=Chryseobacterium sp. LJ668 TaxID=2864040 RepID=UPI001C68A1CD|nr:lanthionine synthetase LanC family protein [Chryseobacterium sp. LJ668]MBW8522966.1 hypothetical protein [Chryseobacterium sp. LJ668]QYK16495.1 hypothetical protein K0U91_15765 [Chryseobacterium sp. LJ668]
MYEDILTEITDLLEDNRDLLQNDYGLLSGLTGKAILMHEYRKLYPKNDIDNEIYIEDIFNSIENYDSISTYCAGVSGACLGIGYLNFSNFGEDGRFDFISDEVEEFIDLDYLSYIKDDNIDFLHGATGIAFYYVERLKEDEEKYKHHIETLLSHLDETGIWENSMLRWKESTNISLSHGMASIVILLCNLLRQNIDFNVDILRILKGAVNYILSQEIDYSKYGSFFPNKSNSEEIRSRLAWCYGDLGVALCLLNASEILNDDLLKKKALLIINCASTRRNLEENFIVDASLCHGASGIAMFFYSLYLKMKDDNYLDTAKYWLDKTIELYREEKIFYLVNQNRYDNERLSLLEGKIGIALAILSIHNNIRSEWQKFLLI